MFIVAKGFFGASVPGSAEYAERLNRAALKFGEKHSREHFAPSAGGASEKKAAASPVADPTPGVVAEEDKAKAERLKTEANNLLAQVVEHAVERGCCVFTDAIVHSRSGWGIRCH